MKELYRFLEKVRGKRIVVYGDVMLDRYIRGKVERVSPEAPVQVVDMEEIEEDVGGAGNVAKNLSVWGTKPVLVARVGDDEDGRKVEEMLFRMGVEAALVRDSKTQTTLKVRIVANGHHILRLDRDGNKSVDDEVSHNVEALLFDFLSDAIGFIVSDYGKGVVDSNILDRAVKDRKPPLVTLDPKRRDLSFYGKVNYAKPNKKEFLEIRAFEGLENLSFEEAGRIVVERHGLDGLLVTLGKDGMVLFRSDGEPERIRVSSREVFDVTGAGDTVMAVFSLFLFAGASPLESARISSLAASCSVEKFGTKPVYPFEIFPFMRNLEKAPPLNDLLAALDRERKKGKRVVMTSGFFDLIHPGHILFLREAAKLGDILVVAINSDESTRRLKGKSRPVLDELSRINVLVNLPGVDYVVVFDEDHPGNLIRRIKPHVYVKGRGIKKELLPELGDVEKEGIELVIIPELYESSSSSIVDRIKS